MNMRKINIPQNGEKAPIESVQNFIIVGANGSGKSHLGAWIEDNNTNVLRISAQRALSIPAVLNLRNEESSWNAICFGHERSKYKGNKWSDEKTTRLIDDYRYVLSCIFARVRKESASYIKNCKEKEKQGQEHDKVPIMITDKIITIWDAVFPHRKIILDDDTIKAQVPGESEYHAKEMSDGERVAIYLIGQCLVAPSNTTIVIDEPEIHLHKSIMHKLWDKIEEYCQDKTLVYITHDLDFAASRREATKIWVKSFDGKYKWDLTFIPPDEEIPDSLMLEVLGNRKSVLFVEGEKGSYDNQLYSYIYENYHVIPCHNCAKVIEMTRAFNSNRIKSFHHYDVMGLIDHDYMTDEEIKSYRESGIYTLPVAEVENLYLSEPIIKIVATHLELNPKEVFLKIKTFLFEEFKKEYDQQLAEMCTREIHYKLQYKKPKENTLEALQLQMKTTMDSIDIENIYQTKKKKIDQILDKEDYDGLLRIYNRKSFPSRISKFFELSKKEGYPNLVLRLLKTGKKGEIVEALRQYTPKLT